jgi:uncharacterized protein
MRPVQQSERIHILDILRGFAIFGILAVNMAGFASPAFLPGYVSPASVPWYDTLAQNLVLFFAEGKFYTIFAFLFGLGFAVQLARADAKGKDIRSFYPRRLVVLFGFGVLHAIFFWTGDILRLYAVLGFTLLAFRKRSNRTLLIWAGALFALSFVVLGFLGAPGGKETAVPGFDIVGMARAAYTSASYLDVLGFQTLASPVSFLILLLIQGPSVMALFVLGLIIGRLHFFERLFEQRNVLWRVLWIGLVVGLIANSLFVFAEHDWLASLGFTIGAPALAAVYVGGLSLLSLRARGAGLLAPLGQVGRMALSNYVLQSVICATLFGGFGFGLYEQVGAAGLLGLTFLIYLAQIPLSVWWLNRFQFGPIEWLWRSLTYGKRQPWRALKGHSQSDEEKAVSIITDN